MISLSIDDSQIAKQKPVPGALRGVRQDTRVLQNQGGCRVPQEEQGLG